MDLVQKGLLRGQKVSPLVGGPRESSAAQKSPRGQGGTLVVRAVGGELGSWPGKGLVIPTP